MNKVILMTIDALSITIISNFINSLFDTSGITMILVGVIVSLIFTAIFLSHVSYY